MSAKIRLYAHNACPQVPTVRGTLDRTNADYDYINIRQEPEAAALVRQINDGNESVPTLVFDDGTSLTEPSARQLTGKLKSLGYDVPLTAVLIANAWNIFIVVMVLWAILAALGVF